MGVLTNGDILSVALKQSAIDGNCRAEDFRRSENKVVISTANPGAREYLSLPFYCDLVSYGDNIVASVDIEAVPIVESYINKYPVEHCFETPSLHVLNDALHEKGMRVCFMAEYFLPDVNVLTPTPCGFEIRWLDPDGFADLYTLEWGNALCEKRKHLDMLAAAAFDKDRLVGLAGASADCEAMWQIGVDVLPGYRRRGIAAALTSRLALEILARGKVPFYCAAWSNIKSVRNAIKSGFRPAWAEVTAKSVAFVSQINQ